MPALPGMIAIMKWLHESSNPCETRSHMTASQPPAQAAAIGDQVGRLFRLTKAWRSLHADPRRHPQGAAHMLLLPLHVHGAMRSQALADATHTDPSTISRHVSLLLHEGLIARPADQSDGRARLLALTDQGRQRGAGLPH